MAIPLITAADVGRRFINRDGDLCEIIVAGNPQQKEKVKYENLSNGRTYWIGDRGRFNGNGSYNRCPWDFDHWEGEEPLTWIEEEALEKGFPLNSAIVKIATELRDWKNWEILPEPDFYEGEWIISTRKRVLKFQHRKKNVEVIIPNGNGIYIPDVNRDRVRNEFKLFSKGKEINLSLDQLDFLDFVCDLDSNPMYWEVKRWYKENVYQPAQEKKAEKILQDSSSLDEQLAGIF